MSPPAFEREALRQQMLVRALWGDARPGVVGGWLRGGTRGLAAYRTNAGAVAERALAAAFPTVQQLLGEESFAALARTFWHHAPPAHGDLARWGGVLPAFVATDPQLAGEPYLADVARLDWAVHEAAQAADAAPPAGLQLLAEADPERLWLRLAPGTALVESPHPVVTLWQAHRETAADRFAPVRAAFAAGRGEVALVWREGWPVRVKALADDAARFNAALLAGRPLASALGQAGDSFDFTRWLAAALGERLLAGVSTEAP